MICWLGAVATITVGHQLHIFIYIKKKYITYITFFYFHRQAEKAKFQKLMQNQVQLQFTCIVIFYLNFCRSGNDLLFDLGGLCICRRSRGEESETMMKPWTCLYLFSIFQDTSGRQLNFSPSLQTIGATPSPSFCFLLAARKWQ